MEALIVLVLVVLFWGGFSLVIRAGAGTIRAAGRAAMGKGSFTDNFRASVVGMGPIETRIFDTPLGEGGDALTAKEIQIKGVLPLRRKTRAAFVTSLFDKTSGEFEPVISGLDLFQESNTRAYQHSTEIGVVEEGIGFISWVRVGVVIPEIIETPYGGKRQLVAILRLIDLDDKPSITQGFHEPDHEGLIWQKSLPFDYVIKSKGYLEVAQLRDKARACCVKVATAVAMWDGALEERQGEIIKNWMQKVLSGYDGNRRDNLRSSLNAAMKSTYAAAQNGDLSLTALTEEFNEIDDDVAKYEAVELCFELLTVRGGHSSDKARIIDLVASALRLDIKELERIRDIKIVDLDGELSQQVRIEDLLGIDVQWDTERIKRHLRTEFQKWNNRLTTLPEGDERNNAQRMLDAISEARKKYG